LKLALSVDNRARDTLVGAALAAGLLPRLLAKLDWRKGSGPGGFGEEEVRSQEVNTGPKAGFSASPPGRFFYARVAPPVWSRIAHHRPAGGASCHKVEHMRVLCAHLLRTVSHVTEGVSEMH